jgi:hypothetical protein
VRASGRRRARLSRALASLNRSNSPVLPLTPLPWLTVDGTGELFGTGDATDPLFTHLREPRHEWESTARCFAERLWMVFQSYADPHFMTEIRRDFSARFWEMYLTCALFWKRPLIVVTFYPARNQDPISAWI